MIACPNAVRPLMGLKAMVSAMAKPIPTIEAVMYVSACIRKVQESIAIQTVANPSRHH